ncbi:hypothetical protein LTV02_11195 [Nocardia yamanashiensis]|uniref:hypothetical protein n=1 Tax=Nocardia yamanashiensis TaxID=209247 RepID=UPI001E4075B9|nr:hypothetical protein [Nocardia yamanashiensis]UGT43909.1 hypothetical protein LTV02_11195 [Nocardia yamanashiensis]
MLYESSRSITSSISPEWARRLADREEPAWKLSWRPETLLDHDMATAAMRLTEMCSGADEPGAEAATIAAALGTTVQHVQAVLHQRLRERGNLG